MAAAQYALRLHEYCCSTGQPPVVQLRDDYLGDRYPEHAMASKVSPREPAYGSCEVLGHPPISGIVVVVVVVVVVVAVAVAVAVVVAVVVVVVGGTRRGKNPPEHDTHVLQCLKVLAGAVNLRLGEILYRPVFGSKFGSKNEAMQDFVASFLFRSSATAEVLHVQLATPIVKCEPAWKLRKINVALMFNHKRSHLRTLAACGIMSIMMFLLLLILSLLSRYYGLYVGCIVIIIMVLLRQFGS